MNWPIVKRRNNGGLSLCLRNQSDSSETRSVAGWVRDVESGQIRGKTHRLGSYPVSLSLVLFYRKGDRNTFPVVDKKTEINFPFTRVTRPR